MTHNINITEDALLDTRAAAACLNRSENTLKNWRTQGIGPAYYRNEGTVMYSVQDLNAYLESNRVSTADQE